MFTFSDSQIDQLRAAFMNQSTAHPEADFYRLLADFGEASEDADQALFFGSVGPQRSTKDWGAKATSSDATTKPRPKPVTSCRSVMPK